MSSLNDEIAATLHLVVVGRAAAPSSTFPACRACAARARTTCVPGMCAHADTTPRSRYTPNYSRLLHGHSNVSK